MRLDRLLQIPHPFKISGQIGMQRLFRREKSLTGLYVQNTPKNDFSRWNKICARTGQNFAPGFRFGKKPIWFRFSAVLRTRRFCNYMERRRPVQNRRPAITNLTFLNFAPDYSTKFRDRLGCRGCFNVENYFLDCTCRVRSGRIFCVETRYAPNMAEILNFS